VCHVWPIAYPVRNRSCSIITCNSAQSSPSRLRSGMRYRFFSLPRPLFASTFFPSVLPLTLPFPSSFVYLFILFFLPSAVYLSFLRNKKKANRFYSCS
jgi:hypothetical protein